VGLIFSHAYVRPVSFKCAVVALPFGALFVDIASWYITKLYHRFAFVVMAAGALMAVCFAFMWAVEHVSDVALSDADHPVAQREAGDLPAFD
jgi:hypothetical protein